MSSRDKKDNKFDTIKFAVQLEVYPDILQKHFNGEFTGVTDVMEAVRQELGWLEGSGIYINQIRVKR